MIRTTILVAVAVLSACRPSRDSAPERSRAHSGRLEEAPLETATIVAEEVQTLPEEPPVEAGERARRAERPCGWSSAWVKPDIPNPFLAGVGGIPMPTKIEDALVRFPPARTEHRGTLVGEVVIGPDGNVLEVTIVRPFEPRWPEAEEAFIRAARAWKYDPPRMGRTPISLCTTILIEP